MAQNVFLTGPKQIGKSTALRRFLMNYPGTIRGFLTRWDPNGETLHMMNAARPEGFTAENIIARRLEVGCRPDPAAFDRIGAQLLAGPADLYVMDELGFMEREALAFCGRIRELLDGPTPVVGVVRQNGSIFMETLQGLDNTAIWHVDGANRDEIPAQLLERYR